MTVASLKRAAVEAVGRSGSRSIQRSGAQAVGAVGAVRQSVDPAVRPFGRPAAVGRVVGRTVAGRLKSPALGARSAYDARVITDKVPNFGVNAGSELRRERGVRTA